MSVRDVVQAAAGVGGGGEYVEDVFSTYLYTGNGSTQTITNGIDLDGEGGLVWFKPRNTGNNHNLIDSARGINKFLISNATNAEGTAGAGYGVTSFNTTGFTLGSPWTSSTNTTSTTYASWSFRKSPKFFDVVTWTGDAVAGRAIPHNLGSVPGSIFIKPLSIGYEWNVWHRSLTAGYTLSLSNTAGELGPFVNILGNDTSYVAPTSTNFTLGSDGEVNGSGQTYVAYVFAHDAGGFGDDGLQNVISCGSYTGTGVVGNEVTLGFEPQWLLVKSSSLSENWWLVDVMRGMPVEDYTGAKGLRPNTSNTEATPFGLYPTATGFVLADGGGAINQNNATYIYIAIRRPMKTPESGTEVFAPVTRDSSVGGVNYYTGFPVDLAIYNARTAPGGYAHARLTAANRLQTVNTNAEISGDAVDFNSNVGYQPGTGSTTTNALTWNFRRAPSVFDVVCYTGTGSARTVAHNLAAVPELLIFKNRVDTGGYGWYTFSPPYLSAPSATPYWNYLQLQSTGATLDWGNSSGIAATPTSTTVSLGTANALNKSGSGNVLYLFATCPGVSKVSSYSGTGADLNVDCGFSAGARFILIKRTDSTGDWYVWDSVRGIAAGNDPYLLLNSTAAEVTSTDYIDPLASGFTVTSSAPAALNASGGTYIFLAIA